MASYVRFSVPKDIQDKQEHILDKMKRSGKIKAGSNEVTKAIERGNAKLVLIAEDVSPPEVVMHLPIICKEKHIPYSYVKTKKELGERTGTGVSTSAIAIVEEGDAKKDIDDLSRKLSELSK